MWWNDYWQMPWMFFGPVLMLIFMVVCMAFMFFGMRGHGTQRGRSIEILKERFARGEIGADDYEKQRRLLLES